MRIKNIVVLDDGMKIFGEDDDGKPLTFTYHGAVEVTFTKAAAFVVAGVRVSTHSGAFDARRSNKRFDSR